MAKLKITIQHVDKECFKGQCDIAILPGAGGELGIMAGHTRLVTPLRAGTITVKNNAEIETFPVEQGFLYVTKEEARVLLG